MSLVIATASTRTAAFIRQNRAVRQVLVGLLCVGFWGSAQLNSGLTQRLDHTVHHLWQLVETVD
jgi:hypothetical protein